MGVGIAVALQNGGGLTGRVAHPVSCLRRENTDDHLRYRPLHVRSALAFRLFVGIAAPSCAIVMGRGSERAGAAGPYSFGTENSWIRVQNVGTDNANVEID